KDKEYWKQLEETPLQQQEPKSETGGEEHRHDNHVKNAHRLTVQISRENTHSMLTGVNKAFGTDINEILITAVALAFKKEMGNTEHLMAVEGHGRELLFEDLDINRTVGWFTSLYPVKIEITDENDLTRQLKENKENIRRIPRKGIGYGILKNLTPPQYKEDIQFKTKPRISFNYLGQFDTDLEKRPFETADDPMGRTRNPDDPRDYEIEISGMITAGQLTLSVTYNRQQYKTETIEALLDRTKGELNRIIAHCTGIKKQQSTPSDFTYKEYTIEALDQLTARYSLEDIYTLSPMQEGMLYHALLQENAATYFEQISYRVKGPLEIPQVEESIRELTKRHEVLRTLFVHEDVPQPVQIVLTQREAEFKYRDIRGQTP
ncbi:MAG: non-ribosomal peptide synthetase, partial [bacterium]|nr:non-ribosomal peptide synthetase [bacterium]